MPVHRRGIPSRSVNSSWNGRNDPPSLKILEKDPTVQRVHSMSSFTSYDLILACAQPGCPACRLEQRSVERFLSNQLYENVNSIPLRDRLRASRGFCREHAWLGVDKHLGDALGYAIIYHDVVNAVLRQLDDALAQPPQGWATLQRRLSEKISGVAGTVLHAFTPRKPCPVCLEREDITRMIVTALVKAL